MSIQYPEPINSLDQAMSLLSSRGRDKTRAPTPSMENQPTPTNSWNGNKTPYNRNFEQNLIDHGVYPEGYEYPDGRAPTAPHNWEEISQRLIEPRPSLSPSEFSDEAFRKFKRVDSHASKDEQVTDLVISTIEGEIRDGRCVSGGIPLANLEHLTDGTLSPGKPDRFYGARPDQCNRNVRRLLSGSIVPSTQEDLPIAPNFFLAAKGPDGTPAEASRSACFSGALGARGIQNLQSYREPVPVYDNNAYTITSIYQSGHLQMYTSHPIKPRGTVRRPEYVMTQLKSWSMKGDSETFRQGITAYRNARDWAQEKRDQLIEAANQKVVEKIPSFESSDYNREFASTANDRWVESDSSDEELALVEELTLSTPSKRPKRERSEADWIHGGRGMPY